VDVGLDYGNYQFVRRRMFGTGSGIMEQKRPRKGLHLAGVPHPSLFRQIN
jgi:hypothetical protein